MLNSGGVVDQSTLGVIEYVDPQVAEKMASGKMNTDDQTVLDHIASAIRRGHPQMRTWPIRSDRVCLVGSGPSLADSFEELRQLVWEGAALVTLNGAYHWCLDRNLKPATQIVMDARPTNARFVRPYVPKCRYVLASQCAPETFDAVADYPDTWIFHSVVRQESAATTLLDTHYSGQWMGVGGGTTVATRAIGLLRMAGYVRFDLFGIDCCWRGDQHHALPQPENDGDKRVKVFVGVRGGPQTAFLASAWHIKQMEDFLTILKINGKQFALTVHGDGMLAHVMRALADADPDDVTMQMEEERTT